MAINKLYTIWGEQLNTEHVLPEYPRPQLIRSGLWESLNGLWEYAFTAGGATMPVLYDGQILVPFSPESTLSGVSRQLQPDEALWYHRLVTIPAPVDAPGARLLLHFGAVDQICTVYVNGNEAGTHTGGYLPFTIDITEFLYTDTVPSEPDRTDKPLSSGQTDTAASHTRSGNGSTSSGMKPMDSTVTFDLTVRVRDFSDTSWHARGKQKLNNGGMFYTAVSGIWQSVWTEWAPPLRINSVAADWDGRSDAMTVLVETNQDTAMNPAAGDNSAVGQSAVPTASASQQGDESHALPHCRMQIYAPVLCHRAEDNVRVPEDAQRFLQKEILSIRIPVDQPAEVVLPSVQLWSQDAPWLYYCRVTMGDDSIVSYFALRTFTIEPAERPAAPLTQEVPVSGAPRICLNHRPQFHSGVLDQGYWPDGIYTPPSDEAMLFDIKGMKDFGFNMVRKHIKIEPERWYYHCDRLGIAVWQDMVCGGGPIKSWYVTYFATLLTQLKLRISDRHLRLTSRENAEGRQAFEREMLETIRLLKAHPCIAVWVIFNEGWGQFDTNRLTDLARKADPTRLIDQASGWFDQGGGDFRSIHHYFFRLLYEREKTRALVLSECGGYPWMDPQHSLRQNQYGYGKFSSEEEMNAAFESLIQRIQHLKEEGFCGMVYTQWTDVEGEVNGIYTYDRKHQKITGHDGVLREIMQE